MKRLLILGVLLLLAAPVWAAAPTLVSGQHAHGEATSVNTINASFPSNVTAGNMILVFCNAQDTGRSTINTPTMTGETFTHLTNASNNGAAGDSQMQVYYTANAAGGQKQVTCTTTGTANDMHIIIAEINGQSTSSPIDASGNADSVSPVTVSTSASTTNATDLVFAAYGFFNSGGHTVTASGGYVLVDNSDLGNPNSQAGDFDLTTSSTGTQTTTFSGLPSFTVVMSIVAIQPPGGGGGAVRPPTLMTTGVGK